MNGILKLYHLLGRWGNLILLSLLILSGLFNRLYMTVKYGFPDYVIEVIIIALAFFMVYRICKKSKFEFSNAKIFKFILVLGLIFRLILAIHDFYDRPVQESDYAKHEELGQRLAFEGEFYDFVGIELRNFRQPGLPFIFAAGLLIYNDPIVYAVIMILFSFGVLISGYFLFRDLKNIASLISFLYLSVSPNMLFMASSSNTQLSFFFFIILLFITLKNYRGKFYQLIIIGALLAAEIYIRFNFLMLFLLIPYLYEIHKEKNISYFFSRLGYIFLFCLLFYSPWIIRNYQVFGTIRLLPTTGLGLYSANVTKDYTRIGGYNGVPDSVLSKYSNLPEIEFDDAMKKETMEFVSNNTGLMIKGLPFKFFRYSDRQNWSTSYFFDHSNSPYKEFLRIFFESIENAFFWVILFFSLMYLFRLKKLPAISIYILWAYLTYTAALFPTCTLSRYNFPYILFPLFALSFVKKDDVQTLNKPVKS